MSISLTWRWRIWISPASAKRENRRLTVSSFQAQIAAEFFAAHAQDEFGRGIATLSRAARQVQQEGGEALFRAHRAEGQQHQVILRNLLAHDAQELVLQRRQSARQLLQFGIAHHADFGIFQRGGIRYVAHFADAVEPDDFAGQMEACDLVAAVFQRQMGFQCAETDAVDRFQRFTQCVEHLAFLDADAFGDQIIHLAHVVRVHAYRQTDLSEHAGGATGGLIGECDSCEHGGEEIPRKVRSKICEQPQPHYNGAPAVIGGLRCSVLREFHLNYDSNPPRFAPVRSRPGS